jgi:hypothetical protein
VRSQIGKDVADVAGCGGRAVAGLADLRLGRRGLDARIEAGEVWHRDEGAGSVARRRGDVATAQRDHGENAACG